MSISDDLMWRYIELLSFESMDIIHQWKQEVQEGRNPRDIKVIFAQEIVTRFYDRNKAESVLTDFEARFKRGAIPDDLPEIMVQAEASEIPLIQLLKQAGLTASTSEALRMIKQGGVKLNSEKIEDKAIKIARGETVILQVGKRKFARITIT
jgi:tyrosyl-tRNA synthetase